VLLCNLAVLTENLLWHLLVFDIYRFQEWRGEIRDFTRHICLNPLVSLQHHASNSLSLGTLAPSIFVFETPGAAFGENVILMSGGQDTTVQAKGDFKLLKWWDVTGDFRK